VARVGRRAGGPLLYAAWLARGGAGGASLSVVAIPAGPRCRGVRRPV